METITAGRWKASALTAIAGPDNVSGSKQLEHLGAAPFTIVVSRFQVIVSTAASGWTASGCRQARSSSPT